MVLRLRMFHIAAIDAHGDRTPCSFSKAARRRSSSAAERPLPLTYFPVENRPPDDYHVTTHRLLVKSYSDFHQPDVHSIRTFTSHPAYSVTAARVTGEAITFQAFVKLNCHLLAVSVVLIMEQLADSCP